VITLTVVSCNGTPADGPTASFDELGGSIGRADSNQMVLSDPERTISRMHAQIVFRNGSYCVVDRGSNPIAVNGRPLGSGVEAPITPGDQLQIGGYLLKVEAGRAAAAKNDPFGDVLAPATSGTVDPLAALAAPVPAPPPADPFAAFGAPASPVNAGGIPDDWDPFSQPAARAPDMSTARGGNLGLDHGSGAPPPLIPDMAGGGTSSIDSLFGLKPMGGGDPLANSMLDAALSAPNMAAAADPMQSLQTAPRASAPSIGDDFSDLHRPFVAPPTPAAPPRSTPAMPPGAVLSWDEGAQEGRTVINPPSAARAARPAAASVATPLPGDMEVAGRAPRQAATASEAPTAQPVIASGGTQALLSAFREGLETPSVHIEALTPELMKLVGQLLHEAASGTVDLLVARSALKNEMHAKVTMIVARENNPLKFSPSGEVALGHLLAPPARGFMGAVPAMRDAYQDLRAHQYGFVAGMRAALEGVLARFDPSLLEGRLTQRTALEALLPGSRKARLWELFAELHAQIRSEAADDFHALFGKAFLEAYEEHIGQLRGDK
jgi:FHA domain-containing protein